MKRIVEGTYEPPERVIGGLPPVIAGCIRKALAVEPAERFQDCAAFREALEKVLDANPAVPPRPSRSYAVTQVGHVAPPSEPSAESAFAATYVPTAPALPNAAMQAAMNPVPPPQGLIAPNPTTSPGFALLLSLFCFGGFGQMYNQQVLKGLFIMGLWFLMAANNGVCPLVVMCILSSVDAYRIAARRRSGKLVGSWEFF